MNYTVLPENELRDKVTQDVATGAGQYDVATVGAYEVPIWAKNDWLNPLDKYADQGSFDKADLLEPITKPLSGEDGKLYATPVLRRVVVPHVPQGHLREEAPQDAGQPDLAQVATSRPRPTARSRA